MVTLDTTTRWVVMLLVAGGVGLIGGIAAALLEAKTGSEEEPPKKRNWYINTATSIFVGGVAAVAAIYFFVPVKEVITLEGGKPEAFYELIKLVPLSLIVGSAGTYFLQSFQQRIKDALAAQGGREAAAATKQAVGIVNETNDRTEQKLDSTQANFKDIIRSEIPEVKAETAEEVAGKLIEEAKKAATEAIQPQVEAVQAVAATISTPIQPLDPNAAR
jgi:hypothetical protein